MPPRLVDGARPQRSRAPRRAGVAPLIACLVGVCASLHADADERPAPETIAEDRLGQARLFFTAAERGPTERDPTGAPSAADARSADAPEAAGAGSPRAVERVSSVTRRALAPRVPRGVFQARLQVGERVRVVVDDRPCRAAPRAADSGTALAVEPDARADGHEGTELHCISLPDGVRALSLDPDGRRLIATLADGTRRWLAVGEAALP